MGRSTLLAYRNRTWVSLVVWENRFVVWYALPLSVVSDRQLCRLHILLLYQQDECHVVFTWVHGK